MRVPRSRSVEADRPRVPLGGLVAEAPLVVLALYLVAEALVATIVVGRPLMLVVAAPIALAAAVAVVARRNAR